MRKTRLLALATGAAATAAALSGCEVNQVNWNEHFYAVSSSCAPAPLSGAAVTVHNGSGIQGATRISVRKVYYGDITHDGIQDAVVLLGCTDTFGGNASGTEIQVFTRDAKPVARLTDPNSYSVSEFGSQFDANKMAIRGGVLYTGAYEWGPGDAHCCPSGYAVYRWDWGGNGFMPVQAQ